jgi:hypothetical protein
VSPDVEQEIAGILGWTVEELRSFSLADLRELLRYSHPKVAARIDTALARGTHIATSDRSDVEEPYELKDNRALQEQGSLTRKEGGT